MFFKGFLKLIVKENKNQEIITKKYETRIDVRKIDLTSVHGCQKSLHRSYMSIVISRKTDYFLNVNQF